MMSLIEDQYQSNLSAFWAEQNVSIATNDFRQSQLSEYLGQYDEVEEIICPLCLETIDEGDDIIVLEDSSTAHWNCFKKENGGLL